MRSTGARIGGGACGTRPSTTAYLRFLADHADPRERVFREVPEEWLRRRGMLAVQTLVEDKDTYLTRPDLGRVLSEASLQTVRERYKPVPQVLIVLSDGLSTDAVLANADEIVPPLTNGLRQAGFTVGDPLFLRYGRVKAEDRLGEAIGCDVGADACGRASRSGAVGKHELLRGVPPHGGDAGVGSFGHFQHPPRRHAACGGRRGYR